MREIIDSRITDNRSNFKLMRHLKIKVDLYENNKKEILKDISFLVNEKDRISIVGGNGVGKTSLLKILTGEISDFSGNIENIGSLSLGYLAQIFFDDEQKLVKDELKEAFEAIIETEKKLDVLEKLMNEKSDDMGIIGEYSQLIEYFNNIGGYEYQNKIARVSNGLGILDLLDKKVVEISGGQRTKVALAKILLQSPDFLLLDEPTNFIDLASVEWLENYLKSIWKGGYIIISHDRDFLDKTCSKTYELLPVRPIETYNGNYSYYVKEKAKKEEILLENFDRQQEFIDKEKKLISRFRAGSRAGMAKSRGKALEKIDIIEKPYIPKKPKFSFNFSEAPNRQLLYFKEIFIGRKEPLFFISETELTLGQKIGIIGENGVGKSTLIKTILDEIEPLEGHISRGKGLQISYYSQLHEELDKDKTLRENFIRSGLDYSTEKLTAILSNYLFDKDDLDKKVREFSGGQISKILFAILGQKDCNFLVLDEPTNHLDYDFREALEKELLKFKGTILFISHDRYFINKIATHLWIIKDQELKLSYGNYDDYKFRLERGLDFDASLFDEEAHLNFTLEEKIGEKEAKRIREKFGRKKK
ncbi:MAG: ABC-F family ATP-binding cassette domain-containing protein [Candidatus Gracilibacteria bacterium]|nr:ABC-F family ATP-binding cassette domain-containing protein [Candidatus Gracilibacteria bacterium]